MYVTLEQFRKAYQTNIEQKLEIERRNNERFEALELADPKAADRFYQHWQSLQALATDSRLQTVLENQYNQ